MQLLANDPEQPRVAEWLEYTVCMHRFMGLNPRKANGCDRMGLLKQAAVLSNRRGLMKRLSFYSE